MEGSHLAIIILIYSLFESLLLWWGLGSVMPVLFIILNILLLLIKTVVMILWRAFAKTDAVAAKSGASIYENADFLPFLWKNIWSLVLLLAIDIAAIVFYYRSMVVFLAISIIYTAISLFLLLISYGRVANWKGFRK